MFKTESCGSDLLRLTFFTSTVSCKLSLLSQTAGSLLFEAE